MTPNRPKARKHQQWKLLVNTMVEIRQLGQTLRIGMVEAVMHDSSALWLSADSQDSRQMFEICQGHEVWVMPQELSGELSYRMTRRQLFGPAQPGPA